MKYRDPKTGEVFEDIEKAWTKFCTGKCSKCVLNDHASLLNCREYYSDSPVKDARLMGLEVVEDTQDENPCAICRRNWKGINGDGTCVSCKDNCEQLKKYRSDKPRICEVLGGEDNPLEVDEVWCVTGSDHAQYRITYDGNLEYRMPNYNGMGYGRWISTDVPTDFIAHPDRIIRKPRFTEEEVAKAAYLHGAWGANARLWRTSSNTLILEQGEGLWLLPNEWFPSLRPGQAVRLEDIAKQ